ncbi:MAG: hypothetical protein WAU00_22410, partial [Caldilinea sp.]
FSPGASRPSLGNPPARCHLPATHPLLLIPGPEQPIGDFAALAEHRGMVDQLIQAHRFAAALVRTLQEHGIARVEISPFGVRYVHRRYTTNARWMKRDGARRVVYRRW